MYNPSFEPPPTKSTPTSSASRSTWKTVNRQATSRSGLWQLQGLYHHRTQGSIAQGDLRRGPVDGVGILHRQGHLGVQPDAGDRFSKTSNVTGLRAMLSEPKHEPAEPTEPAEPDDKPAESE